MARVRGASLNAVTAIGAGDAIDFGLPVQNVSMQVVITGAPATAVVLLEGTIDGTNYATLATFDLAAGDASKDIKAAANAGVMKARANLTALGGGASPTVTATIASFEGS